MRVNEDGVRTVAEAGTDRQATGSLGARLAWGCFQQPEETHGAGRVTSTTGPSVLCAPLCSQWHYLGWQTAWECQAPGD